MEKLTYTYDLLGRRDSSKINTTNPFVTEYQYKDWNESYTSTLLEKISYSGDRPYIYAYDANGNITSISTENNGTQTLLVSYEYDALNQLMRENHYDNGGNITSIKEYAYTTGEVSGTPVEKTYTYGDTEWKDLLTNYNGTAITYDAIGNPLNWTNGKTFTWTAGRQLSGVTDANNTITYTYDDNGIRTSKTVNGIKTDYYLNGTAIIMQKTGDNCIWYTYDESGNLSGLRVGSSEYYYYRNGQGDIIGIIDGTGSIAAKYSYDAWGNPVAITDGNGNDVWHIANINPFRYRGYYYDVETGLYYLQSRYYDSQVGRFVNADGYVSTGQGILEHNMFVYCLNNCINMSDPSGMIGYEGCQYIAKMESERLAALFINQVKEIIEKMNAIAYSFKQMAVCTDGIGAEHNDEYHASSTAYMGGKLNADVHHYIVIPTDHPQYRDLLGAPGIIYDRATGKYVYGIVGEGGPKGKYGEVSISTVWDLGYKSDGSYGPKSDFEIIIFPWLKQKSWNVENLNEQAQNVIEEFIYG